MILEMIAEIKIMYIMHIVTWTRYIDKNWMDVIGVCIEYMSIRVMDRCSAHTMPIRLKVAGDFLTWYKLLQKN